LLTLHARLEVYTRTVAVANVIACGGRRDQPLVLRPIQRPAVATVNQARMEEAEEAV
jgi:hypothetical protein